MKNKMTLAMLFLLLSFSHVCCKKKSSKENDIVICQESSIDSIRVYYYNYSFDRISAINCEDIINRGKRPTFARITLEEHPWYPINYSGVIDTLIIDCKPLLLLEESLKNLKAQERPRSKDMRMIALIYFKNGTHSQVCITETNFSGIYLDGVLQERNNHFLYLIRYYSGYYSWFSKKRLSSLEELQDTTFVRDSIAVTYENNPRVR